MTTETTLAIEGLSTRSAEVLQIADALVRLRGVGEVQVDSRVESARIEFDPGMTSPVELLGAVEAAGFRARELVRR